VLKPLATSVARSRGFERLVALLERMDHEPPDLLRVLTYHRVERDDASPAPDPALTIGPEAFEEQMRHVRARWRPVSVAEVLHAVRGGGRLPRRAVLVTFDDGYRDFRTRAWPVLDALAIPVVLFVPTAFPGHPHGLFWWDRLHHALMNTARGDFTDAALGTLPLRTPEERVIAYRRLRARVKELPHSQAVEWVEAACRALGVPPPPPAVLNWEDLRELARAGVTVGSHTRTHALLTRIPLEEARLELAASLDDLERELGPSPGILAYPAGAFGDEVVLAAEQEGYALGFTTVRGLNPLPASHPLKLRRINVGRRTSLGLLRAQLAGRSLVLNRFYPLRAPGAGSRE
jgi:peptidoglycan/xylan/chitin deacetylase (PgdA/CDA1 family)